MPLSDYAHHNEEAQRIWWEEEGRWEGQYQDPHEPDDESWRDEPEPEPDEED